jgi:hypothetical protein
MRKKKKLSQQILSYLEKHPDAGDTLEGIVTWWLDHERIEQVVVEVSEALRYLVRKGAVRERKFRNGATIYKIKDKN